MDKITVLAGKEFKSYFNSWLAYIFIGLFVINILMMFIGLAAIRFAARLIMVPTSVIVPTVMLLCFVGIYAVSNSFFNVGVLLGAGILGYVVRKLGYSIAPLSIGFVLGPILENSLRQSLVIADGSRWDNSGFCDDDTINFNRRRRVDYPGHVRTVDIDNAWDWGGC